MRDIQVFDHKEDLFKAASEIFLDSGAQAQQKKGRFSVVLSGGSTPGALYRILAKKEADEPLDWDQVHFFWGDERTVGPEHPDSNFRSAYEALLGPRKIPERQIQRMPGELPPEEAARKYQDLLQDWFGAASPRFDLILLGLGDDGHTASLFPGTALVREIVSGETPWVAAVQVPQLDTWRITMTPSLINNASLILFLVTGVKKARALKEVLNGPPQPETYPAQLIQPDKGALLWLVDREAAAEIDI